MRPNLIKARLDNGFTQEALGKQVGLSNKGVSALERGRMDTRPAIWDALEDILKVPQRELRKTASK